MRFTDRRVVVTGVGRAGQVGEAIARAFTAEGAQLAMIDRHPQLVIPNATSYTCDLTDPVAIAAVAKQIGPIDALILVAGGFAMSGPIGDSDPAAFAQQLAINLTTAYLTSRAFVPLLREKTGSVVYFATAAVLPGSETSGMAGYIAAKAGVVGLMHAVAEEGRSRGVRANAVAPTAIRTGDNLKSLGDRTSYVERETVAATVLYLASDAASAITGQVIRLG